MFKPKKNKGTRAAQSTQIEGEEGEDQADVGAIRQLQQARSRKAGLGAEALLAGDKTKELDLSSAPIDDEEDGNAGNLAGGFAKAQNKKPEDEDEDPEMQAYIEAELAKRTGKGRPMSDAEVLRAAHAAPAPDVLEVPENLRGRTNDLEIAGTWVSGITEVALPLKYKMENIEATEEAKKKLLLGATGADNAGSGRTTPEQPMLRRSQLPVAFGAKHAQQALEQSFVAEQMRQELRARSKKRRVG